MRTTFAVAVTYARPDIPFPATRDSLFDSFEDALHEASLLSGDPLHPNAVVTVWARQGRNMWPVRILYPGIRPVLATVSDHGIPHTERPTPHYMVDTQHPLHTFPLPDCEVS